MKTYKVYQFSGADSRVTTVDADSYTFDAELKVAWFYRYNDEIAVFAYVASVREHGEAAEPGTTIPQIPDPFPPLRPDRFPPIKPDLWPRRRPDVLLCSTTPDDGDWEYDEQGDK